MQELEEIYYCLNCPRESCNDCLGKPRYKSPKSNRWQEWQLEYVRSHHHEPIENIANAIGKTRKATQAMKSALGFSSFHVRTYTAQDDDFILTHDNNECALKFGVTKNAISARRTNLKKKRGIELCR